MKRLIAILLACVLAVQPVYADNGKMGKRQKTKEEKEIEAAENEKKYQMFDSNGVRINLFFEHGKYSKTPAADVKKKAQSVNSDTKHLVIADLRYGHMCLFVYEGKKGKRKLVRAVRDAGGLALKFVSPGMAGVPDRLLLFPGGRLAFCEVKAPGEKPRPLQVHRLEQLRALGFKVYVVDGAEKIGAMLCEIQSS